MSIVILTCITLWVVVAGQSEMDALGDREVIHQIAAKWRERWPQAPGPPTVYASDAVEAVRTGDGVQATKRLAMALSLDPNRSQDWSRMICLSAVHTGVPHSLTSTEIEKISTLFESLKDPPAGWSVARQWRELDGSTGHNQAFLTRCFNMQLPDGDGESVSQTLDTLPPTP